MFNRFARAARFAVLEAVREAQHGRAPEVTEEHLLLALLGQRHTTSSGILESAGVTSDTVTSAYRAAQRRGGLTDAEAASLLGELGIDVDRVVEQVESTLGENVLVPDPRAARRRVPFAGGAKAVLERALREATDLRVRELRDEHLLLAIAASEGVAAGVLADHGLTHTDLRARLAKAS